MNTGYILLLAFLAIVCLFMSRHKKDKSGEFKEISTTDKLRTIRLFDMDETQLQKAIDEFIEMYGDVELPDINPLGESFLLTFKASTDYVTLCYWVNYLVYSDESKQRRFSVLGWYPFGEVTLNGEKQLFINQTVMLYVEEDDNDYDNVRFVTPNGNHYLQPFPIEDNLILDPADKEPYRPQQSDPDFNNSPKEF